MENKCKRFLSLLLAFVMVLGLFPMGHAHAEAHIDGNTINMVVGDEHSITVDGDYSHLAGNNGVVEITTSVQDVTMKVMSGTPATEIVDGEQYVISSKRSSSAGTYVSAAVAGKGLKFANTANESTFWTFEKVSDGVYRVSNASVSDNANKMSINGKNSVNLAEDASVNVWFDAENNCWKIYSGENNCLNAFINENPPIASCWDEYDDGSKWELYHVERRSALTTSGNPVTNEAGLKNNAQYLIISANQHYRAGGGTRAVLNTLNGSGNLPTAVVDVKNFAENAVWTLEIAETAENGHITGKIKTADGKCLAFVNNKVTLADDAAVTIEKGTSNDFGNNKQYTWGINFGSTYMNYSNPVGNWNFDNGSHWCFYEVYPSVRTTITVKALAAGETHITVDGTEYHIVVTDEAVIDPFNKANWTKIHVDSETRKENENAGEGEFAQAWDGDTNTKWHSNWRGADGVLGKLKAHGEGNAFEAISGEIDFGAEAYINRFSFLPRQDDTGWVNGDGVVTKASLYVKDADDAEWNLVAENVEFVHDQQWKTFEFPAQNVKQVRFEATRSVNDGWVVVSEFDIGYEEQHSYTEEIITAATCSQSGLKRFTCSNGIEGADCTCHHTYTEVIPATGVHTPVTTGAVKPTLCTPGATGTTVCGECGMAISENAEITTLPVAEVLNGNKLVALNDCEYTYNGTSLTHTAADGTTYYVKPASFNTTSDVSGKGGQAPQTTTAWTGLSLNWQENGSVWIEGNGSMHIWTSLDKPYWDKCGGGHGWISGSGTHDLYLFAAGGEGTEIPGYTRVSNPGEAGLAHGNYLIAAQKGDAWYVMHPSASDNAYDHIALYTGIKETAHTPGAAADCENAQTCTVCGTELNPALNHTPAEAVKENEKAATCTADGSYESVVYCSVCGEELSREANTIPALEHTAGEPVVENEKDATCTEDGSYDNVVYCTVCKAELSRETNTVDALGHTAGKAVVENEVGATCTEDGSYESVVYCSVCGEELSRETFTVDALGHTAGKAVVENEKAATCAADGSYDSVVYCSVCGEELSRETNTIPALDHTPAEAVKENEKAATCTEDGSYDLVVYCSVCEAELSRETNTVDALGHDEIPHEAKDPTCTESGWAAYVTCSRCDYTTYEEIPAVGHTDKNGDYICDVCGEALCTDHDWIDATCTAPKTCSKCGVTEGKALGHTEQTVKGHPGTCFEPGLSDGVICSVCGTVLVAQEETAPVHTLIVHVDASAPTCTKNGNIEYWYCVECGSAWLDEECRFNTNLRAIILPATGHSYEAVFTQDPTCTEHGYTSYACTVCGHTIVGDYVTALGHTAGEPVIENEKDATCTEDGSYDSVVYCTVCEEELSRETNTVDALGHTAGEPVVENKKDATCTEDGSYDLVVYCSVCKAELSRETNTVDALGHTAGEPVVENEKAATCTEDGSYDSVVYCTVCEAEISRETNTVGALGHKPGQPVVENEKAATCTEDGSYDNVVYCSVCDAEISRETVPVPAKGHRFSKVEVTPATCTEDGYVTITCGNCNKTFVSGKDAEADQYLVDHPYFDLKAKGHTAGEPVVENEKAATCTEDGSYDIVVYCTVCEAEISRETNTIPAAHTYTNGGYLTQRCCTVCNAICEGFDNDSLYINGWLQQAYQLVEYQGAIYFVGDAHKIVKDTTYYLTEEFTAGKFFPDGRAIQPGYYEFDADGKMVIPEAPAVKNGVIDGYLYINDQMQKAYQLVEFEGSLYFISDAHKVAVGTSLYLNENFVAGVKVPGTDRELVPGYYEFDAEGKMLIPEVPEVKNGVIDGYLYINDQMQKAYQLVEFEGSLYFISDAHKVAVGTSLYLNEDFVANVKVPGTDKALKPGYYEFDAEGKMVITEVKEGVIDGYLYIDGQMQKAYQLVEFENHIYFVYDAHKIAVSTRLYLSEQFVAGKTFNGEPIAVGYYEFDENGWMIIE